LSSSFSTSDTATSCGNESISIFILNVHNVHVVVLIIKNKRIVKIVVKKAMCKKKKRKKKAKEQLKLQHT